jgi:hypothetical protein
MNTINRQWRVISDDIQWILQCWREPSWRNHSFCRTSSALRRCIREYCGEPNGATLAWLAALPEWREPSLGVEAKPRPQPPLAASEGGLKPYVWAYPPKGLEPEYRGPTPGALQGDDYPLTCDANGYPEIPACLDRRKNIGADIFEEAA